MSDTINSILAVDFGSTRTRVLLIDIVDGMYRMVSRGEGRTSDGFPANDIFIGFERILSEMSEVTGWHFLNETGQVITPEQSHQTGVDFFAVTASLGRPLRAVIIGLVPGLSIASAIHASSTNYIEVAKILSTEDDISEEEQINAIVLSNPDIVFITGGIEGGAENALRNMAKTAALAVSLIDRRKRPSVIYSGNSRLDDFMEEQFKDITAIFIAENVRPSLDTERLDSARLQLGQAYDRYAETRGDSFSKISAMSQTGVLPSAQGYGMLADYYGRIKEDPAMLIDVGSAAATLAYSVNGQVKTAINTEIGLGHSAESLLNYVGIDAIRRWLPFNISESELYTYAANKGLRPASVPATLKTLHIEHAMLKAGIRRMLQDANPDWFMEAVPFKRIVSAGGALTRTGDPNYDALLVLDAIQPAGVTVLESDPYGLVAAMGAIAPHAPEPVVQILEGRNLRQLAIVVSADGKPKANRTAFKVTITTEDGDKITEQVNGGHLWSFTLPAGKHAAIEVQCARGVSINGQRSVKFNLSDELAGVILDARGRPVPLGKTASERAQQIPMWISELTGEDALEIPAGWLEAVVEKTARKSSSDEEKKTRRGFRLFGGGGRSKKEDRKRQREQRREAQSDELSALLGGDEAASNGKDGDGDSIEDELNELRDVFS